MRQKVIDLTGAVGRQLLNDVLQIRIGVMPADACRMDQGPDRRGPLARTQAASEQPVGALQRHWTNLVLHPVVRNRHLAVIDVERQPGPALQAVVNGPAVADPGGTCRRCNKSHLCKAFAILGANAEFNMTLLDAYSPGGKNSKPGTCLYLR